MELELVVEEPASAESRQDLIEALVRYQTEQYGEAHYTTVGYYLRTQEGALQAGLSARFRWGWLYVEMLWVAASLRGQGYGSKLLEVAEGLARARGGVAVQLESGGEHALPFYAKHGYEVVGSVDGYPPGSKTHFLRKWLAKDP